MRRLRNIAIGLVLAGLLLGGLRQASPVFAFSARAEGASPVFKSDGSGLPAPAPDAAPTASEAPELSPAPTPDVYRAARDLLPPEPSPTQPPAPTPFSVVWIGDTQTMVYRKRLVPALVSMGQWIRDNTQKENIVQVLHTGDLVENGFNPNYWKNFYEFYDRIGERTPFFAVAGNHDIGRGRDDYSAYLAQPFLDRLPGAQKFDGGVAAWTTLEAGGETFLFLGAGYDRSAEAMPFLKDAIRAHPNAVAVLLTHSYMSPRGVLTKEGKRLRDDLLADCPEVRLVLCGHTYGTALRKETFPAADGGTRRVYAMLQNFQKWEDGGQMRLLTFDPAARTLTVTTFSPYTGKTYKDGTLHRATFVLENAF